MSRGREEKRRAEKDRLLPLHPLITLVPAIAIPRIYQGLVQRCTSYSASRLYIGYLFSFWIAAVNLSNARREMPSRFEIRVLIDPALKFPLSAIPRPRKPESRRNPPLQPWRDFPSAVPLRRNLESGE